MKKWLAAICILIYVGYVAAATILNSQSGEPAYTQAAAKHSFEQLSKAAVNIHHHVAPTHASQSSIIHPLVSSSLFAPLNIGNSGSTCDAVSTHVLSPAIPLFLKYRVLRL